MDNNSTDGSADWVETTYGEQIELIKLKKNNGFAGGYNEALENRTADYFVLLNSDATPKQKRWLKPLVDLLEGNPNIAAAQPKILSYRDHDKFEYAGADVQNRYVDPEMEKRGYKKSHYIGAGAWEWSKS